MNSIHPDNSYNVAKDILLNKVISLSRTYGLVIISYNCLIAFVVFLMWGMVTISHISDSNNVHIHEIIGSLIKLILVFSPFTIANGVLFLFAAKRAVTDEQKGIELMRWATIISVLILVCYNIFAPNIEYPHITTTERIKYFFKLLPVDIFLCVAPIYLFSVLRKYRDY
jgi:hypothetical protein